MKKIEEKFTAERVKELTISETSFFRFGTMTGSNVPSLSLGTDIFVPQKAP